MTIRFLYRNRFRTVTFCKKERRSHNGGIRSSSTRFPDLGALGRISWEGWDRNSCRQAKKAALKVQARAAKVTQTA